MTKKRLGTNGPEITRVGLGTWAIGGAGWKYGWGSQDDADSIAVIHEALDLGINWIDTAAVYGLGHSEEVVGRALTGRRDKVLVATKCGRKEGPGGSIVSVLDAASVRAELKIDEGQTQEVPVRIGNSDVKLKVERKNGQVVISSE